MCNTFSFVCVYVCVFEYAHLLTTEAKRRKTAET